MKRARSGVANGLSDGILVERRFGLLRSRAFDEFVAHVVWAVKLRRALLLEPDDERLLTLLRTKAHDLGAAVLAAGAADDHVHVILRFPAASPLATIVGQLKGVSSRVVGLERPDAAFAWQDWLLGAFLRPRRSRWIDSIRRKPARPSPGRRRPVGSIGRH